MVSIVMRPAYLDSLEENEKSIVYRLETVVSNGLLEGKQSERVNMDTEAGHEIEDLTFTEKASWVVCSAMGAGEPRDMAKRELQIKDGLKLIPWASVAARIPPDVKSLPGTRNTRGKG
jgi:hypothetical protein